MYELKLASETYLPYFRTLVNRHVRNRTVSDEFRDLWFLWSRFIIIAPPPTPAREKNLVIMTDAEKRAVYDLPDFDEFQRTEYFSLTEQELALA